MTNNEIKSVVMANGTYDKVRIDNDGHVTARICDTDHWEPLGYAKYFEDNC